MKAISNVLLDKDRPNTTGKPRLYYVKFYNDTEMYLVGLTLKDCIEINEIEDKIKKFHTVDSWKDLLQKQPIISTTVNQYKRTCITLQNFFCYYDEYANNYYIVNKVNKQTITLK